MKLIEKLNAKSKDIKILNAYGHDIGLGCVQCNAVWAKFVEI